MVVKPHHIYGSYIYKKANKNKLVKMKPYTLHAQKTINENYITDSANMLINTLFCTQILQIEDS